MMIQFCYKKNSQINKSNDGDRRKSKALGHRVNGDDDDGDDDDGDDDGDRPGSKAFGWVGPPWSACRTAPRLSSKRSSPC